MKKYIVQYRDHIKQRWHDGTVFDSKKEAQEYTDVLNNLWPEFKHRIVELNDDE